MVAGSVIYFPSVPKTKGNLYMTNERKGMIAATIAYCIFGLSYLFSNEALDVVGDPIILLSIRFTITFVALNVLVLTGVLKLQLKGKNLLPPILLGIIQPVLYFVMENYGLMYTSTAFTGMVSSISPIFSAILGAVMLREMPTGRQWLFICISIAGVMMVSLGANEGENTLFGCLCLLGAYFSGAFYSILVRKLSKTFTSFELTYIMFVVGFVFFAGFVFVKYGGETPEILLNAVSNGKFIGSALYLGVLASVCAYMLVNYSLKHLSVARSTIFTSFSTVVSVVSGVVIRGDNFSLLSGVAFALMLVGVWGVNKYARGAA